MISFLNQISISKFTMNKKIDLSAFLKNNVKPALGCTDVVVIGLAGSVAYLAAQGRIPKSLGSLGQEKSDQENDVRLLEYLETVEIELDRNIFKNAQSVNLPMPDGMLSKMEKGIEFAASLGIFSSIENYQKEELLTIFSQVNPQIIKKAKELKSRVKFKVEVVDSWTGKSNLNVRVKMIFNEQSKVKFSEARITHSYTHISHIANSNGVLYQDNNAEQREAEENNQLEILSKLSLPEMISAVQDLPDEAQQLLQKNIEMNTLLSNKGLEGKHGLKLGYSYREMIGDGFLADDLVNYAKSLAAAAGDARMGGAKLAAMSTAGSGNQGITATVPIIAVANKIGAKQLKISSAQQKQRLMQSLALSHLITSYIAFYSGELSALCGCAVKAGVGVSAGLTYYLGGEEKEIAWAMENVVANITGMICDGAKEGCALKLATAAGVAVESALLAMKGVRTPTDNGILASSIEQTLKNIGDISEAMIKTDQVVVQKMMLK